MHSNAFCLLLIFNIFKFQFRLLDLVRGPGIWGAFLWVAQGCDVMACILPHKIDVVGRG